jgi:hypothetical protein
MVKRAKIKRIGPAARCLRRRERRFTVFLSVGQSWSKVEPLLDEIDS